MNTGGVRLVARRAETLLRLPARAQADLALVTDRAMRALNRRTRGRNRPTDVLAFPLSDRGAGRSRPRDPDGVVRLGDVVVSLDTARRQARAVRRPLAHELAELFAHGLLHVCGYDHQRPTDSRRMHALTKALAGERGG